MDKAHIERAISESSREALIAFAPLISLTGKWYEFSLELFIPNGESHPTDWIDFLRWLGEDHGQLVSNLSLTPSVAWDHHVRPQ